MYNIQGLKRLSLGAFLAMALAFPAGAQAPDEGHYVSAAELAGLVEKPKDGLATAPVPTGPGATVLAARRDGPGEVEVHERLNDEFVVQAGHATARVGGKVTGNRRTAPGEWRGGTIAGGRSYQLAPGDVLWIPAGSPHQVTPKGGTFRYLAFKFEAKPTPAPQ
ncbi:cupin domain-containing protein [Phenylobacterium sp.]|uniref:cupin domain-containing protein n=1 Tax=Phenylobacterium sp. TaxID=1871053 RepID=UPI002F3FB018